MEFIIGFVFAVALLWLASEPEGLAEYSERVHINHLADRSRARKAPGTRGRCRYAQTGWRPGTHGNLRS